MAELILQKIKASNNPSDADTGGSAANKLNSNADAIVAAILKTLPDNAGSAGQILTKTSTGQEWKDAAGGSGMTDAEKSWLGQGVSLENGAVTLPAGINSNTASINTINAELAKRFPFKITSFSGGKIAEKGTTQSANLTWVYDGIPTSQTLTQNGANIAIALSDRSKNITDITTNTTFTLTANSVTASQSVMFYNCKYIGTVSATPTTESEVKALTKLPVASNKNYTWTGNLDNTAVCYCYPKAFGTLSSVKDANNFDYLSGYTRTEITVNGEAYYVYVSGKSISNNFKQIFA